MSAAILLALLLAVAEQQQAPPARARPPRGVHDTVRIIVQPPPTVNVAAPSQTPTVVFGIVGALLLGMQLWIMKRQADTMNRQTTLIDRQTTLQEQQATVQRTEAIGTFIGLPMTSPTNCGRRTS